MIKNLDEKNIINNKKINLKFLSVNSKELSLNCKIYRGNFYLDSFNYFPITTDYYSFLDLYSWKAKSEYNNFFSKKFYLKFDKDKNNFKSFKNVVVLGSSPGNNYFRNLITFIPRILFISDSKINLAIHRQTSNKLRKFIENILKARGIEIKKYIFLDNFFYGFENSQIPQFFPKGVSINILNKFFKKNKKNKDRIYLTRKNAKYRKIINESDLIDELKSKNFKIIDLDTLDIEEQAYVFSSAKVIISPTSSALTNIVFCQKETKIFEIHPKYQFEYENNFKFRYSKISNYLGCKHYSLEADPIPINDLDNKISKFIDINIAKESNYYKNLLVKKINFNKFISQI